MIALPPQIRAFLYRRPTDMRKSFHGLVALTESVLMQDPLSGSLLVFLNLDGIDLSSARQRMRFQLPTERLNRGESVTG